jgi:anti-sigma-K factor RskA
MCIRRQQMPLWLRLNYLALALLLSTRAVVVRGSWRSVMGSAGAIVLVIAIALMFAERRRGSGLSGGRC